MWLENVHMFPTRFDRSRSASFRIRNKAYRTVNDKYMEFLSTFPYV